MRKDGIIIYIGYAPLFNTEIRDCANPEKQNWALLEWTFWKYWRNKGLRLTSDCCKVFNKLVGNMNMDIEEVYRGILEGQRYKVRHRVCRLEWMTHRGRRPNVLVEQ